MTPAPWTQVEDIVKTLRRRWDRGQYLTAFGGGEPWVPVSLTVRSPSAADVVDRLDDVRRWLAKWERDSRGPAGSPRLRTEYRTVSSRSVGANQLPARAWVDTPEDLCELIGTTAERRALEEVLAATETAMPVLRQWAANHPLVAIASQGIWPRVLATLAWVVVHDTSQVYLRQLDVDGVDTKFVERNYKLLEQLLLVVAPERVDPAALGPARRLGFRDRPQYVRLRFLGRQPSWPPGISEARLRGEEIPAAGIAAATVFIVENEVSYLAFPDVPDSIVMFGSGYALEPANTGAWLEAKEIAYWGDIDTHGFAILSNLRQRYPKVVSVLMDTSTLIAHQGQWAHEPVPANRLLPHLTTVEAALYQDLVEDRYGHSVRLEQERIRFSMVNDALRHWVDRPRGRQPS